VSASTAPVAGSLLAYIPSPPVNGLHLGSFELHVYGLLIACGVVAAVWLAQRRWEQLGGAPGTIAAIAVWAVPAGLVGARLYSLATSWQVDTGGSILTAVEIWHGGLGIWGGVLCGVLGGYLKVRRMKLPFPPMMDVVAPALPLAQAIGRWGNYFNQELFGRPTHLPWAVKITDPTQLAQLPLRYRGDHFFQPTFLYESIWDLICVFLLIAIERRFRIRRGYLFASYAAAYTAGRFWTEFLRIDDAHHYLGLRLNDWTSLLVFAAAMVVIFTRGRAPAGEPAAGDPLATVPPGGPADAASQATPQTEGSSNVEARPLATDGDQSPLSQLEPTPPGSSDRRNSPDD
jgi:prolipoprotein diacylglyceryl transferase